MPSLTIKPPKTQSSSPPLLQLLAPGIPPANGHDPSTYPARRPSSPVAPEFSPITPRAQPAVLALPVDPPPDGPKPNITVDTADTQPTRQERPIAPAAQYIPQPPPQPFSSEDSTDAIALRAAISSLQFQKKTAQDDIRRLQKIRQRALVDPTLFRTELAAGRLSEQRPRIGDLQAILAEAESGDEDDEVVLGASRHDRVTLDAPDQTDGSVQPPEIPDSQPSRPHTSSSAQQSFPSGGPGQKAPFDCIPGPQNVVRMPYVNWDKYHISGAPLDAMHEQQRKWPGSNSAYGQERGREFAVTAPYSPWADAVDARQGLAMGADGSRKDSGAAAASASAATPTATVSEHPMETRRGGRH